jgi:2-dehydro-3-deoxygluconokinase
VRGEDARAVACLGEALILVSDGYFHHLAGAEANVAVGLSALGVSSAWIGRLGDDDFGAKIHAELQARGVDVSSVERDPLRPTGHYSKEIGIDDAGERRTTSRYQRSGSAASAMEPDFLDRAAVSAILGRSAVLHCSGITAALSESCRDMMFRLLAERPGVPGLISFDVNWREQLWPDGDPAVVVDLAGRADLVLVGADEAVRVLGTDDPTEVRRRWPEPGTIVIKDGARRALAIDRSGTVVSVPALQVDVVEPVGAGDAFAAGYLSGLVCGDDVLTCLRRGHIGAAATLTVASDWAPPVPGDIQRRLLECSLSTWSATTVTAEGFAVPEGDQP